MWIVIVTSVSFVVALVMMAWGPQLAEVRTADPNTFSASALGHRALVEFLERGGTQVTIRRTRQLIHGRQEAPIIVAEPDPTASHERGRLKRLLHLARIFHRPI